MRENALQGFFDTRMRCPIGSCARKKMGYEKLW
jgi:hypothetical protein